MSAHEGQRMPPVTLTFPPYRTKKSSKMIKKEILEEIKQFQFFIDKNLVPVKHITVNFVLFNS